MFEPTKLISLDLVLAIAHEANPLCQNECWRVGNDPTICICEEFTEHMMTKNFQESSEE